MACARMGLRSRGYLERCAASWSCCAGVRGRSLACSQARKVGRVSERKCSGRWRALEAALIERPWRLEASKVGRRGPPPS
eukprot:2830213-Pleurochrysis_carterae.AAC.1